MKFFKGNKFFCIKQHDYKDWGCACLATICKQYGVIYPISKIREIAGTDKLGTSALGVVHAAENLGFSAKGVKANNPGDIFGEIPLQAIAHFVIDKTMLHYVVIHKISKKEIIVADPAKGSRVIIMIQANSQVNTKVLRLLPKLKIIKNRWCTV